MSSVYPRGCAARPARCHRYLHRRYYIHAITEMMDGATKLSDAAAAAAGQPERGQACPHLVPPPARPETPHTGGAEGGSVTQWRERELFKRLGALFDGAPNNPFSCPIRATVRMRQAVFRRPSGTAFASRASAVQKGAPWHPTHRTLPPVLHWRLSPRPARRCCCWGMT
jgi:hypothetical protein